MFTQEITSSKAPFVPFEKKSKYREIPYEWPARTFGSALAALVSMIIKEKGNGYNFKSLVHDLSKYLRIPEDEVAEKLSEYNDRKALGVYESILVHPDHSYEKRLVPVDLKDPEKVKLVLLTLI